MGLRPRKFVGLARTGIRKCPSVTIEGFKQALAKVAQEKLGKRSAAIRENCESMMRQLEDESHEYDQLKNGNERLRHVERLDQIALFIAKIRIAKGVNPNWTGDWA